MRSTFEIGAELDEKQKQKQVNDESLRVVEQDIINLRYEVDKLRVRIREKEMLLVQAKFNSRKVDGEMKILTREFWNSKNDGL